MTPTRLVWILIAMAILGGCNSEPPVDPAATKEVPGAKNGGVVPSPNGEFNQTSDRS